MNDKVLELQKRTISILEGTKKQAYKYTEERKKSDEYLRNYKDEKSLIEWEKYLLYFEKKLQRRMIKNEENRNGKKS